MSGRSAVGDIDSDGHKELAAEIYCNGGGVAWPEHLVVFRDDLTMVGDINTLTIFPDVPVYRSVIQQIIYENGEFNAVVAVERDDVDVNSPDRSVTRTFHARIQDGSLATTVDPPVSTTTSAA